jgi:hypothetical protein
MDTTLTTITLSAPPGVTRVPYGNFFIIVEPDGTIQIPPVAVPTMLAEGCSLVNGVGGVPSTSDLAAAAIVPASHVATASQDELSYYLGIHGVASSVLQLMALPQMRTQAVTIAEAQALKALVISKAAFINLFTDAEFLAIATAAPTNPRINVWLIKAQARDQIDLTDPLAKQGLDALVAASLLSGPRETAILANQKPS